jgi:hypothetical protein
LYAAPKSGPEAESNDVRSAWRLFDLNSGSAPGTIDQLATGDVITDADAPDQLREKYQTGSAWIPQVPSSNEPRFFRAELFNDATDQYLNCSQKGCCSSNCTQDDQCVNGSSNCCANDCLSPDAGGVQLEVDFFDGATNSFDAKASLVVASPGSGAGKCLDGSTSDFCVYEHPDIYARLDIPIAKQGFVFLAHAQWKVYTNTSGKDRRDNKDATSYLQVLRYCGPNSTHNDCL